MRPARLTPREWWMLSVVFGDAFAGEWEAMFEESEKPPTYEEMQKLQDKIASHRKL